MAWTLVRMVQEKPHAPVSDYTIGVPWGGWKRFWGPDLPPVEGKEILPTLYDFWLLGFSRLGSLARCSIAALRFVRPLTAQPPAPLLVLLLDDFGQGELHVLVEALTEDRVVPAKWESRDGVDLGKGASAEMVGAHQTFASPPPPPPPRVPSASGSLPCTLYPLAALKIYLNSLVFASPVCLLFMLKVSWKI